MITALGLAGILALTGAGTKVGAKLNREVVENRGLEESVSVPSPFDPWSLEPAIRPSRMAPPAGGCKCGCAEDTSLGGFPYPYYKGIPIDGRWDCDAGSHVHRN